MNKANHHKIIALSVPALPAPSRSFWEPLTADIAATCMLPDEVAIPLLNGERGPWRGYFPPDIPKVALIGRTLRPPALPHPAPTRLWGNCADGENFRGAAR